MTYDTLNPSQLRAIMAEDDRWITVYPHGKLEGHKGQPVLLDNDDKVKGGFGGKFKGLSIKEICEGKTEPDPKPEKHEPEKPVLRRKSQMTPEERKADEAPENLKRTFKCGWRGSCQLKVSVGLGKPVGFNSIYLTEIDSEGFEYSPLGRQISSDIPVSEIWKALEALSEEKLEEGAPAVNDALDELDAKYKIPTKPRAVRPVNYADTAIGRKFAKLRAKLKPGETPKEALIKEAGEMLANYLDKGLSEIEAKYTEEIKKLNAEASEVEAECRKAEMKRFALRKELTEADFYGDNERVDQLVPQVEAAGKRASELREKGHAIRDKIGEKIKVRDDAQAEAFASAIREIRGVTKRTDEEIRSTLFFPGSSKPATETIIKALKLLPADWVETHLSRGKIQTKFVKRGYFNSGYNRDLVCLSHGHVVTGDLGVALHELGHRMEYANPHVYEVSKEFFNRRTAGCQLERIYFGKSEYGYKDHFLDHYMGKKYDHPSDELLSMGADWAYLRTNELNADPDYRNLIFGILTML